MFNRRKTPRLTAFLWKTTGGALRGYRSGDRAPDATTPIQPRPNVAPRHNVGAPAPRFRPGRAFTASVNGCVVFRFAAPLRVTGAFRCGLDWQLRPAGDPGPVRSPRRSTSCLDLLPVPDETELNRGRDARRTGLDNEPACDRVIGQVWPRAFNFFYFTQTLSAEVLHRIFTALFRRIGPKLAQDLTPGEAERARSVNVRYTNHTYKSRPSGERFRERRMCISRGTGCARISLKNSSPRRIVESNSPGRFGPSAACHQYSDLSAISDDTVTS